MWAPWGKGKKKILKGKTINARGEGVQLRRKKLREYTLSRGSPW